MSNRLQRLKHRLYFWRIIVLMLVLTCIGLPFLGVLFVHIHWPMTAATIAALSGVIITTEFPINILINKSMKHISRLNKQEDKEYERLEKCEIE